jgi:hypothetical protein
MRTNLTILSLFIASLVFAQRPDMGSFGGKNAALHDGQISGKLVDAKSGDELPFANVRLFRKNDILMEGTITDEKGSFQFNKLGLADYYFLVNYIGYEEKRVEVSLNKNKTFIYLKKVKVEPGAVNLKEVSINEDRPVYESKMEKIVYNAENDLNEGLDDATDVLRKTPLLSVDLEGNVNLRGSSNIKFLVNGKESTFFSGSAADALQMIPAEQVKSVEVITSPTAKYDGEGGAGIINIITQQKQISGFKSTINGSVGTRVNKQSLDINYGKGNFGFSARARIRYGWPLGGEQTYHRFNYADTTTLTKNAQTIGQWIGFGGTSEMYYDINPYNSLVTSVQFRGNRQTNTEWANDSLYTSILEDEFLDNLAYQISDTSRYTDSKNLMLGYEWTTDYVKKFSDHEDRELRLAFQLGGDVSDQDNLVYQDYIDGNPTDSIINKNDGSPLSYTYQLDYTHPLKDKHTIEVGAKYINRNLVNDYSTLQGTSYLQPLEQFDYTQNVASLYLSTKWELTKKWGAVVGLRAENTLITGQWNSKIDDSWLINSKGQFENEYTTLLPSFILSRKIDMMKSIKASYSKRISRPGMRYINPNTSYTDVFSQDEGNPYLKPELTHQVEVGYNSFARKYKGSYYLFAKQTYDLIESNVRLNGDTAITSYQNLGENLSIGVNYYGSITLGAANLRAGFNLYTYQTTSDDLGRILFNWNMGGNYDIGKGYKAETFGFFRQPNQTAQGYVPGFSMFSFGFKKEFNNKKGSVGLRFIEPFKKYKSFETELQGDDFYLYSNRNTVFRSIGISFKYTFGELRFDAIKNRTNIRNDDIKQGGDSQEF